jgi:hypothetical protein
MTGMESRHGAESRPFMMSIPIDLHPHSSTYLFPLCVTHTLNMDSTMTAGKWFNLQESIFQLLDCLLDGLLVAQRVIDHRMHYVFDGLHLAMQLRQDGQTTE